MKKEIRWFYKGLNCEILETSSGWIYNVNDIGAITKKPLSIIYGGSPNLIEKKDVETKIDDYCKSTGTHISNSCPHYSRAVERDICFFAAIGSCADECIFNNVIEVEKEREEW